MRQLTSRSRSGFTIIELLIVIVIIAILAAITIVAYNGITAKAHAAALQSDLSQDANVLGEYQVLHGTYPATQAEANLSSNGGNTLTYNVSDNQTSYCLQASGYSLTYFVTQNNNTPTQGYCNSTTGVASTSSAPQQNGGIVTTIASNGVAGYVNGPCSSAEFNGAQGLAVDASGNIYVAGTNNNVIRKITVSPTCTVSTFAGNGTQGYADGTGTTAEFNQPTALAFDTSGNLYVADDGNNVIRKVTPSGDVSTYAGTHSAGLVNGPASSAQFKDPFGIAVDAAGNVYVAERNSNVDIRKISNSGVVSTLAGNGTKGSVNGPGASAEFMDPQFLATDASGNVYVGSWSNGGQNANWVRMITPAGVVSTLAGNGVAGFANGAAASAEFDEPASIAVSSNGTIYVADTWNTCIRAISSGTVSTFAGTCGTAGHSDGVGGAARFTGPWYIAIDDSGNLYVTDLATNGSGCYIREIH